MMEESRSREQLSEHSPSHQAKNTNNNEGSGEGLQPLTVPAKNQPTEAKLPPSKHSSREFKAGDFSKTMKPTSRGYSVTTGRDKNPEQETASKLRDASPTIDGRHRSQTGTDSELSST